MSGELSTDLLNELAAVRQRLTETERQRDAHADLASERRRDLQAVEKERDKTATIFGAFVELLRHEAPLHSSIYQKLKAVIRERDDLRQQLQARDATMARLQKALAAIIQLQESPAQYVRVGTIELAQDALTASPGTSSGSPITG